MEAWYMSRSGYSEDCDWDANESYLYRANVDRAIAGKRGQAFLKEMLAVLNAMPEKRLAAETIIKNGEVCAMGAVARARGIDVSDIDPEDDYYHAQELSKRLGIASQLVREIAFENDGDFLWKSETPEERFVRVRRWVESKIKCA
jgi:hypothetical protein